MRSFRNSNVCSVWLLGLMACGLTGIAGMWSGESSRCAAATPVGDVLRPIRAERNLVFRELPDKDLTADLFRPDDAETYPLVIMIHGGAWSAGDKWQLQDHARELAQAGFVAVTINYRLAPAHQIDAQIEDCRQALLWAVKQAAAWNADPHRVCLWGYSAGGHLAALLATDPEPHDPPLRAVVAGGAPCEFTFIPAESRALAHVMGGTRAAIPQVYEQVSPLAHATPKTCPIFFFHGTGDLLVPATSSRQLYDKLRELQVDTEYCVVEDRGHLFTFIDPTARQQAIAFLQRHTQEDH